MWKGACLVLRRHLGQEDQLQPSPAQPRLRDQRDLGLEALGGRSQLPGSDLGALFWPQGHLPGTEQQRGQETEGQPCGKAKVVKRFKSEDF